MSVVLWNGVIVEEKEFRGLERSLAECGIKRIFSPGMAEIATVLEKTNGSLYELHARNEDAPGVLNCLTLMSWVLLQWGLLVAPLLEIATLGEEVAKNTVHAGDLLFTHGIKTWYSDPVHGSIGHVGIATPAGVMHATRRRNGEEVNGVIEESLEEFLTHAGPLRVIRRLIAQPPYVTLTCDAEAWKRDPPHNAEEVREYIDRSRSWFDAQLIDM